VVESYFPVAFAIAVAYASAIASATAFAEADARELAVPHPGVPYTPADV